mgnify:CR=1 FL=1
MGHRDLLVTFILGITGTGLGQIYTGQKRKGLMIMGIQFGLLVLAGLVMFISGILSQIVYMIIFGIGIWSAYDALAEAKYINDNY